MAMADHPLSRNWIVVVGANLYPGVHDSCWGAMMTQLEKGSFALVPSEVFTKKPKRKAFLRTTLPLAFLHSPLL